MTTVNSTSSSPRRKIESLLRRIIKTFDKIFKKNTFEKKKKIDETQYQSIQHPFQSKNKRANIKIIELYFGNSLLILNSHLTSKWNYELKLQ